MLKGFRDSSLKIQIVNPKIHFQNNHYLSIEQLQNNLFNSVHKSSFLFEESGYRGKNQMNKFFCNLTPKTKSLNTKNP